MCALERELSLEARVRAEGVEVAHIGGVSGAESSDESVMPPETRGQTKNSGGRGGE